jgi:hypothetical protein
VDPFRLRFAVAVGQRDMDDADAIIAPRRANRARGKEDLIEQENRRKIQPVTAMLQPCPYNYGRSLWYFNTKQGCFDETVSCARTTQLAAGPDEPSI